jgi:hypothetical protein
VAAYLHCWRVVGHVMGLDERLMPAGWEDSARLFAAVKRQGMGRTYTPDGPERPGHSDAEVLTGALAHLVAGGLPRWLPGAKQLYRMMARHLLDPATAAVVGLPGRRGSAGREARWTVAGIRALEQAPLARLAGGRLGRPVAACFGQQLLAVAEDLPRGAGRAPFQLPPHLARAWRLPPRREPGRHPHEEPVT